MRVRTCSSADASNGRLGALPGPRDDKRFGAYTITSAEGIRQHKEKKERITNISGFPVLRRLVY